MTLRRGRRSPIRRALPWLCVVAVLGLALAAGWRAFAQRNLVQVGQALRQGDIENGVLPDPVAALSVLEERLAEAPGDYEAWIECALAWQDLRSPEKAVECFKEAADCTPDLNRKVNAKVKAMLMLTSAERYEEAVTLAEEVVALQPDAPLRKLQLGMIHLQGSQLAQRSAAERLHMDPMDKRVVDVRREEAIESFVSDVWRERPLDELLDEVAPAADVVVRAEVQADLVAARDRFRAAYAALQPYPDWGEFDVSVARAYCQVLERAGQLYDAHIEAAMALREPHLPLGMVRDLLEVQAKCSIAIGDYGQAADRYGMILDAYVERAPDRMPYHLAWAEYALRIQAGQWDWILANIEADRPLFGNDPVLRWAYAAALAATGKRDEARVEIAEPYNAVAFGTKTFTSPSLKAYPDRRRDIAMLAFELYSEVDTLKPKAALALEALLAQVPDDQEALRLHVELSLATDDLTGAQRDAFALIRRPARDHADYRLWMDVADRVSQRRHGMPLKSRAEFKVAEYHRSSRDGTQAAVDEFKLLGLQPSDKLLPRISDPLYVVGDPALTLAIVDELVASGDLDQGLTELRKLVEEYPDAHELQFRLGLLLVRTGQYDLAAQKFEDLLERVPDDAETLDLAMRTNRALGRRQQAADLLDRMILGDPLGVGVSRHGQELIAQGRAAEAVRLVERIARWTKLGERPDVLILAARGQLAQGHIETAEGILTNLTNREGQTLPVALLALDVGMAKDHDGLIDQAVQAIRPLLPELLPDQMEEIAHRLWAAGRMADLAQLFPPEVTQLPSARPALRLVADALKTLGDFDRAELLLEQVDDEDSLLDRFLLLGLLRRQDQLAHPLQLDPAAPAHLKDGPLCLLLAAALDGEPSLVDSRPGERLAALGVADHRPAAEVQLLDGLLRILPFLGRPDDVRPKGAADHPLQTWPDAGEDLAAVLELAKTDRPAARRLGRDLLFLVMLSGRDFWTREATALAYQVLAQSPGLSLPRRVLARSELAAGQPEDALRRLQPLLAHVPLSYDDLAQFLQACHEAGRNDWATATVLHFEHDVTALRMLGEDLERWGLPDQARSIYERVLKEAPDDLGAQRGLIRALAALGHGDLVLPVIVRARATFPDDKLLAADCAQALASMPTVPAAGEEQARAIELAFPDQFAATELLVRLDREAPDDMALVLESLIRRLDDGTIAVDAPDLPLALVRIARMARLAKLTEPARKLLRVALRAEPGSLLVYRELAQLELDQNELDTARRYLDLLTFVDVFDRDAGLTLAELHFQRLGQPDRAADVVRRTYPGSMPIEAAEILAAEAYLHGHIKEALNQFFNAAHSPLISAGTYLTVARIAYAGGQDDTARQLYDQVLQKLSPTDPRRPRAQWLRSERLQNRVRPEETVAAQEGGSADAGQAGDASAPAGAPPTAGGPPTDGLPAAEAKTAPAASGESAPR